MRRIFPILAMLLAMTVVGSIGFRWLTKASWLDSVYLAIITLTTVGSREPKVMDDAVQVFVIGYLIFGLGIFTYSAFSLGQALVSAQLESALKRRRMSKQKEIDQLTNHYIVCGQGRMGTTICAYLSERRKPFVVIDINEEELVSTSEKEGWMCIPGDATDDDVLLRAGIERAHSLATVLPTDADNIYVVLSARMLASNLQIIARAGEQKAIEKMERAGATRIVSPFSSGAVKMARFMLTPSVEDFLEIADTRGNELELADVQITPQSPYVGKKLSETDMRDKGVMVIGIRRANGERLMPPPGSAIIQAGDCLFAFGSADSVNEMIDDATTNRD